MKKIKLIPCICGAGGSTPGAERGPLALAAQGLEKDLAAAGLDVAWIENPHMLYEESPWGRAFHENLPPRGDPARRRGVLWHAAYVRDHVSKALEQDMLPVTVGGDHSMAAGSIAGLAEAKNAHGRIGVIWIDAHPDINTPDTSPSQAFHGMPMAALLGMGDIGFATLGGRQPVLKPEHIFYLGLRDIDPGEEDYIKNLGIRGYSCTDIDKIGVEKAFQEALTTVSKGTEFLVLSVDLDAFDPSEAPAVGSPVPDGLRRKDVVPVLADMVKQSSFDLFEVAEFNPALPGAEPTYQFIRDLLKTLLADE